MRHMLQKPKRTASRTFWRCESGQSLVEFSLVFVMLIVLSFGVIDFCRAIYLRQLLVNLSRETANLEARGSGSTTVEIMTNALNAAILEGKPLLDLSSSTGMVIVSSITNYAGHASISRQFKAGSLVGASSAVAPNGTNTGNTAWLPNTNILPADRTVYVAEIYYGFTSITPVSKFINAILPAKMGDIAYFSAL